MDREAENVPVETTEEEMAMIIGPGGRNGHGQAVAEARQSAARGGTGRTLAPRGIPKAMPRGGGTDPTASIRALPEGWLQHAWHCVLDMAEPTTPPQTYSYGITGDAQNNLEATMLDMDAPARMTMMLEFLRVMSMILWDVATTIQRALDQADTVEVVPEQDDEDAAMVQTEAKLKQKHKPKSTRTRQQTNSLHGNRRKETNCAAAQQRALWNQRWAKSWTAS